MRFPYKNFDVTPSPAFPGIRNTLRPIIPITLMVQGIKLDYSALVDSGADFCIFHSLVGELLGLDVESGKEANFGGVGGNGMRANFHTVRAQVGDYRYDLYCGFTRDISADGYGVLGQMGFYDRFRVNFNYKNEEIEVLPQ